MLKSVKIVQQRLIEGRQGTERWACRRVWCLVKGKGSAVLSVTSDGAEGSGPLEGHLIEAHTISSPPSREMPHYRLVFHHITKTESSVCHLYI